MIQNARGPSVWREVPFLILWVGQAVSQAGSSALFVAVLWVVSRQGPGATAIAGVALTLPSLASVFGGVVADRVDRVRLLLSVDAVRTVLALALTVMAARHGLPTPLLLFGIGTLALGASLVVPTTSALLPIILPSDLLATGNGLSMAGAQAASVVGYAVGGALVAAGGLALPLGANAIGFLLSAASLVWLDRRLAGRQAIEKSGASPWNDLVEGLKAALDPITRLIVPLAVLANLLFAPMVVGLVLLARALHLGSQAYALLEVGWAAGALIGGAVAGSVVKRVGWLLGATAVPAAGGLFLIAAGSTTSPVAVMIGLVIGSGASNLANAVWFTWMQRRVPNELRGRVFGVLFTLLTATVPLGIAAYGPLAGSFPPEAPLLLAGLGLVVVAGSAASIAPLRKSLRDEQAAADGASERSDLVS